MSSNQPHLSIENWLEKLDLLIYKPHLKDYNGVEEILWMSERDLKNIGINNGSHRARMSSSLTVLKDKFKKTYSIDSHDSRKLNGSNFTLSRTSISPIRHSSLEIPHTGVRSWPSTKPSSLQNTKNSSPRLSMDAYSDSEATAADLKKALERELSLDISDLRSHAWYHGTILRQRAEELVKEDGDFLVRDCISQPGDFVITCKWKHLPLHFIIKKVILQPDTVYERIQYAFEKESFDSIPDFITYYVGSKCPLSENSGVIISQPVNRSMPLSYYASRYGIQCQIHYVAKALEKLPADPPITNNNHISPLKTERKSAIEIIKTKKVSPSDEVEKIAFVEKINTNDKVKCSSKQSSNLTRIGSDPTLCPNTEKKTLETRPNSGLFNSDALTSISLNSEDKPPPKPSRVPSKRCTQRPFVIKRERKLSDDTENNFANAIPVPNTSLPQLSYKRQQSETRFSFLDRPSISSDSSTPDIDSANKYFTIPKIQNLSSFEPQNFKSVLLTTENLPLEATVLYNIRNLLLSNTSRILACHLTRIDLGIARHFEDVDLGMGVTSGLEYFLLPQGDQMLKDLYERIESMKLFVAVSILTSPEEEERMKLLNKWIEIALETKTTLGNFYGFSSIMLGLTLPEIMGLHSTWLALRHSHTEVAFAFETKLRPTFKSLHNACGPEAPNTCFPYILSLILILKQYILGIDTISNQSETTYDSINFSLPGSNSSDDFGLQLIADHLEIGRNILQQVPLFRKNGQMSLCNTKYDDILINIFQTEFHLRMLWGFKGSIVCSEDRHRIFQKVIHSLYNKCVAIRN